MTLEIWMYNSDEVIYVNNEEDIARFYQSVEAERKFARLSDIVINLRYVERAFIEKDEDEE